MAELGSISALSCHVLERPKLEGVVVHRRPHSRNFFKRIKAATHGKFDLRKEVAECVTCFQIMRIAGCSTNNVNGSPI